MQVYIRHTVISVKDKIYDFKIINKVGVTLTLFLNKKGSIISDLFICIQKGQIFPYN